MIGRLPSLVGRALRKVPRFAPARVVTAPAGMPSTDGSTRRLTIYLHDHDPGAAVLLASAQTAGVRRRAQGETSGRCCQRCQRWSLGALRTMTDPSSARVHSIRRQDD